MFNTSATLVGMNGNAESKGSRVTQKDVADLAGVSRGIVSYVINNGPRPVAPETRQRVLDAIERLGYRPNKFAQQLIREQAGSVAARDFGLILPDINVLQRPYYGSILSGIYQIAHQKHYRIRFIRIFEELENPALFNELIHREEISGLLLLALDQCIQTDDHRRLLDQIRQRVSNIVCLEWHLEGVPSVSFDRANAAVKATRHLQGLGRETFAYIGQQDERIFGFQLVAGESAETHFAFDMAGGQTEIEAMLARGVLPQAVVCGSDEVAFGVLRGLHTAGITVPHDVAIASIDDIPMAAYAAPPLTTVSVPKFEMGRYAVELLINPPSIPSTTLLPTTLIKRASCGG